MREALGEPQVHQLLIGHALPPQCQQTFRHCQVPAVSQALMACYVQIINSRYLLKPLNVVSPSTKASPHLPLCIAA